jgi:hypothetical protein
MRIVNTRIQNLRVVGQSSGAVATDEYFNLVTLLLPGNGTNGQTNNTFLDSSTNNFAITRNGNTTQGTFSPFSQTGWSNYFDGTGDYLSVPNNSAFAYGTGDFTIEFWFYMSALAGSGNYYVLYDGRPSGTNGLYVNLAINNATPESYVNGATVITGSALSANTWYHFAYARSGSSTKMFINGSQVGSTYTDTTNYINGADRPVIGTNGFNVAQYSFNGYISNFRVVKGTAIYTSAFTPPTAPLTAISGTSLLTCQSNRFIDNSTNAFAITVNGNTSVQAFSPFDPATAYSAETVGGSAYFDGTGDYLTTASSSNLALASGDFTIEMWVYPANTSSAYRALVASDAYSGTTNGWTVYQNGASIEMYYAQTGGGSTPNIFTATSALVANAWQHLAVSRSSGTLRCFVNGVQVASVSNSIAFAGNIIYIGDNNAGDYFYNGYLSNVRIVKGTAVYTSAFTPPTAPVTAIANTQLLLNYTNGGITDAAAKNVFETVGSAQISTAQSKFGGSAMAFDGTADYLVSPNSSLMQLGSENFTIEGWVNFNLKADWAIVSKGLEWSLNGDSNRWVWQVNAGTVPANAFVIAFVPTVGQWYHFACVRNGSTTTMYINGSSIGSGTSINITNSTGVVYVGRYALSTGYDLNGYINDLRITKGYARYTANFTPPTQAFPTQ